MARKLAFFSLLVLLAVPAAPAAGDDGAFTSKELNFEIHRPEDSVDWKAIPIDETKFPTLRVHYRSVFVDSGAYAEVQVWAQKLDSRMARMKLDRIGAKWKDSMEHGLENAHDRKEEIKQFAGVDALVVDVKGIKGTDNHRTNWMVCKNGELLYTIIVHRSGEATKDEDIDDEIQSILGSFKFQEIKKVTKAKGAKKGEAPKGPGGNDDGKGEGEKGDMPGVDPKKLKKEKVESSFWRIEFTKPEGLVAEELTQVLKDNQIKWSYRGQRNTIAMGFRVYVWSLKNKSYTLDQLVERKLKWWKTRVKQSKEPKLDKKYKGLPRSKKAYKLELLGRSTRTERWIYIMGECDNDRQYQIEIYTMGDTGNKEWGKAVDQLIKSIKPQKK